MEAYAKELSEKTGCKIVRMSYYLNHFRCQGKMIYTPKVEEFLSLINYADYVITDSFHCTAFSLNFHKEFFIFYPGKYSTRLQSILELTGTTHRVMNENKDVLTYTKDLAILKNKIWPLIPAIDIIALKEEMSKYDHGYVDPIFVKCPECKESFEQSPLISYEFFRPSVGKPTENSKLSVDVPQSES